MLKSIYRREPLVSFVVTVGAVDVVMGSFSEHSSLTIFGLGLAVIAVFFRGWQARRDRTEQLCDRAPQFSLPPTSSRPKLPSLSIHKKKTLR